VSTARFPGSQTCGNSQVTFPVTRLLPAILYNM
jgi:hypothetical protein